MIEKILVKLVKLSKKLDTKLKIYSDESRETQCQETPEEGMLLIMN